MKRFAYLAVVCGLFLSGCGSSSTSTPKPEGASTGNGSMTAAGPSWPLPGVSPNVTVTQQDFAAGFTRANLAQLGRQGVFIRSTDPSRPQLFDEGELLAVHGMSPSAHVAFFSDAFFGSLEYEPSSASGLALSTRLSAEFIKNYCVPAKGPGYCAKIGRATGVIALLTPESVRSEARGFNRAHDADYNHAYGGAVLIRPPGYQTGMRTTQAGHQLGYELGGPVKDARNFVTQYDLANAPAQSSLEDAVRNELVPPASGSKQPRVAYVFLRVTPDYQGTCVAPYQVRYEAVGSDGWQLPENATGIAASWLRFGRGSDGLTVAVIRNAEQSGSKWLVPGQDPRAVCVPSDYSG